MNELKKVQVILFKKKDKKMKFLLLKRIGTKRVWWQGISAGVEEIDKGLKETCVRELGEELGVKTTIDKIVGPLLEFEFVTNRKGYEGQKATESIFGIQLPNDFEPKLSDEHSEYRWLNFKEAYDLIDFDESKKAVEMLHNQLGK